VLVLLNGSAVAVNWARDHVPAIVESWYGGEAAGEALADVLFGDYNPAGRLPVTFYKSADQIPAFDDYSMKGKTYRYFTGEPLFPFGYGLSYTKFAYKDLKVTKEIKAGTAPTVSAVVTNTGNRDGEEVVQVYLKPPAGPIRNLVGFERVALKRGESKTVTFTLRPRDFATYSGDGRFQVAAGSFELSVGGKQPGFTGAADASTTSTVSTRLTVTGPTAQVN